jgi:hypothetical protein
VEVVVPGRFTVNVPNDYPSVRATRHVESYHAEAKSTPVTVVHVVVIVPVI